MVATGGVRVLPPGEAITRVEVGVSSWEAGGRVEKPPAGLPLPLPLPLLPLPAVLPRKLAALAAKGGTVR